MDLIQSYNLFPDTQHVGTLACLTLNNSMSPLSRNSVIPYFSDQEEKTSSTQQDQETASTLSHEEITQKTVELTLNELAKLNDYDLINYLIDQVVSEDLNAISKIFEIIDQRDEIKICPELDSQLVFSLTSWSLENEFYCSDREHILKKLSSLKLNWDAKDYEGTPFLIFFVKSALDRGCLSGEFFQIVQFLVNQGVSLDVKDRKGNCSLHYFFKCKPFPGGLSFLEFFIEHHANLNVANQKGLTPLSYALKNIRLEKKKIRIIRLDQILFFLKHGASPDVLSVSLPPHAPFIFDVCLNCYLGILDYIIDKVSDLSCLYHKETLLHILIRHLDQPDNEHLVSAISKIISRSKPEVLSLSDRDGLTPLHLATKMDHLKVVNLLLEKGADALDKTPYQETVLHIAAQIGSAELVSFWLSQNFDPNQDSDCGTPLQIAVAEHAIDCIELLLAKGGKPYEELSDQVSPVDIAQKRHDVTVYKLLTSLKGQALAEAFFAEIIEKIVSGEQTLPSLRPHLNYCFINSDLKDVQDLMQGLWIVLNKSLPNDHQEIKKLLVDIAGGFFTWGSLISRFPAESDQLHIVELYNRSADSSYFNFEAYVNQQVSFGSICFETILEALSRFEKEQWSYWQLIQHFALTRQKQFEQKASKPGEEMSLENKGIAAAFTNWRSGPLAKTAEDQNNWRTVVEKRYLRFARRIQQTFHRSVDKGTLDKISFYGLDAKCCTHINYDNKVYPLTTLYFRKIARVFSVQRLDTSCVGWIWNHPDPDENLSQLIESLHDRCVAHPSNNFLFQKLIPLANTLMSNSVLTQRGFAQYSLMWLVFMRAYHSRLSTPIRLNVSQLDCTLISQRVEKSVDEFEDYFESFPLIISDFSSIEKIKMQAGSQFLGI